MELTTYLSPLRKWWWLLILGLLISATTSFLVVSRQPLVYETKTTLLIGQALSNPNPSSGEFYLEQQLASIYADMASRELIQSAVMDVLKITRLPEYTARAVPNTQLIEIIVTDTDPYRGQSVANELARQLILYTPTGTSSGNEERQKFIDDQLDILQQQIQNAQQDIEDLQLAMGSMDSARQISDTQEKITALELKVGTLQTAYAGLSTTSVAGANNSIQVISPAQIPSEPVGPKVFLVVAIAALFGLIIACGGAYLIEFSDHSIKSIEEINKLTDLPVIGRLNLVRSNKKNKLNLLEDPYSLQTNTFRSIRTQLEIFGVGRHLRTLLVLSPGVAEGKSTISLNLALIFSNTKKEVILVDTDYYKSSLSASLGNGESLGYIDVVTQQAELSNTLVPIFDGKVQFLPSGKSTPDTTNIIGKDTIEEFMSGLRTHSDIAIIDSPPFIMADALDLATQVDGVLLVVRIGQTLQSSFRKILSQAQKMEIPILGIIMNGVSLREDNYARYYKSNYNHKKVVSIVDGIDNNPEAINGQEQATIAQPIPATNSSQATKE